MRKENYVALAKVLSIFPLAVILLFNLAAGLIDFNARYRYTTLDGGFRTSEDNFGNPFGYIPQELEEYKKEHPAEPDTVLHRTFRIEPGKVWRWGGYLFHPRYRLPYVDPAAVPEEEPQAGHEAQGGRKQPPGQATDSIRKQP